MKLKAKCDMPDSDTMVDEVVEATVTVVYDGVHGGRHTEYLNDFDDFINFIARWGIMEEY